jgi:hypothetical protein
MREMKRTLQIHLFFMWRKSFHHPSSIAKVRLSFFIRKTRYLMSLIYLFRSLSVPLLFEERFLRDVALDPTCQVHVAMGHMPCGFLSPTHLPSLFFPTRALSVSPDRSQQQIWSVTVWCRLPICAPAAT